MFCTVGSGAIVISSPRLQRPPVTLIDPSPSYPSCDTDSVDAPTNLWNSLLALSSHGIFRSSTERVARVVGGIDGAIRQSSVYTQDAYPPPSAFAQPPHHRTPSLTRSPQHQQTLQDLSSPLPPTNECATYVFRGPFPHTRISLQRHTPSRSGDGRPGISGRRAGKNLSADQWAQRRPRRHSAGLPGGRRQAWREFGGGVGPELRVGIEGPVGVCLALTQGLRPVEIV
jgi:hypothetical protein